MEIGPLKPLLTAFAMPPVPALLLLAAAFAALWRGPRRWALGLLAAGTALLVALSSHGVAVALGRWLLPAEPALQAADIARLRAGPPGTIVVLGGGVRAHAAEYGGAPALAPLALERLVYGLELGRATGWPVGYAGGQGWAERAALPEDATESAAARRTAAALGTPLAWTEDRSRDTRENARNSAALLAPRQIRHVALVTHAWHMPRAEREFRAAGLDVIAAPMGALRPAANAWLEWLPSAAGLAANGIVLREWLGLQVQRWEPGARESGPRRP